ncbi:hypothetical protein MTO96_039222 [Rhipicephalus appendiculatus]
MTTSAPTDPVCDNQTGATCHLFADITGGTITEPAANSHASGEATASMERLRNGALVVPWYPPATQAYGQHAAPPSQDLLCRLPKGGSVSTYAPYHDLAQQ